jgi:hypothetical protein
MAAQADEPVLGASTPAATPKESPLQKAARIIAHGEAIIDRQRERVFHLRRHGLPADEAETLLRTFQEVLFEQRKHLAMLQNRQRRGLSVE